MSNAPKKNLHQIRIQVTPAQLEWLDRKAEELGDSRSSVIRSAIRMLIESQGPDKD